MNDFFEKDLPGEILDLTDESINQLLDEEEPEKFNLDEYLSANYDYWFLMYFHDILIQMEDLRKQWKVQNFRYTKEQKDQYEMLLALRRARITQLKEEGRVAVSKVKTTKKVVVVEEEDWTTSTTVTPSLVSGGGDVIVINILRI